MKKEAKIPPLPSRRLTEFRKAKGLSQEELAVLAETTNQQIGRLERGIGKDGRKLTYAWAEKLAPHLNRHPEDFFKEDVKIEDIHTGLKKKVTPGGQDNGSTEEEPMKLGDIVEILTKLPEESLNHVGRVAKGELLMIRGESASRPREGQS